MPRKIKLIAFFVSDGTGLMTQFEDVEVKQIRIPFLDNFATVLQELKPG